MAYGATLLSFPEDVMVDIVLNLDIFHVAALRQVCKKLCQFTHIRELWVKIVQNHIISNRLPWPSHALPLTTIPTRTIELLAIRCILMEKYWDNGKARGETVPAMVFRYPRGSIAWLHIIRSRWLVIGLTTGSLDLVDLENDYDDPVACFKNLKGHVACGVTTTTDERIVLTVHTSLQQTYCFSMNLPHLGVKPDEDPGAGNFELSDSFPGYTTVLGAYGSLLAFASSALGNLPAIVDRKLKASVHLAGGTNVSGAQHTVDIQFRPDIVVIAKDWNIEIYSMNNIATALHQSSAEGIVQLLLPLQSLPYPEHRMPWKLALLRPLIPAISSSATIEVNDSIRIGAFVDHDFAEWTIRAFIKSNAHKSDAKPVISYEYTEKDDPKKLLGSHINSKTFWGDYGHRLAYVGGLHMEPLQAGGLMSPRAHRNQKVNERAAEPHAVLWTLPCDPLVDFAWICAFDEAAGLIAVGLASGRVHIIDALSLWKHSLDQLGDVVFTAGNL
ncbi:hypothetical protein FRB96_001716 [Tulasnella sp. 330]|nr:hypothetical protein FRB96_001716 [Tulasnella sp. 330]KAG8886811.1 hypothetical protein FRB98_000947 [Tulasnella sp. 332]